MPESASSTPVFDLIGVGSPIMDLLAPVSEDFLAHHKLHIIGFLAFISGIFQFGFWCPPAGSALCQTLGLAHS